MTAIALTDLIGSEHQRQGGIHFRVELGNNTKYGSVVNKSQTTARAIPIIQDTGDFANYVEAIQYKKLCVDSGYNNASIDAFFDHQKITVEDAIAFQNTVDWIEEESKNMESEDNYWNSLRYVIQVGKLDEETVIEQIIKLNGVKSRVGEGFIYYTYGEYSAHADALKGKEEVLQAGITGAYLVAFIDGEKVLVEEAVIFEAFRKQMGQYGPEII